MGRRDDRRRVFLTGASGTWGLATARELAVRADRFLVAALVHPSRSRTAAARELRSMPNVRVVVGDVTDSALVGRCVAGADVVLHVAAVVSPFADDHPELARRVNVGAAETIVRAVRSRPAPAACAVVMVGSVAETGDRNPPHHWGRVGDPVRVSRYDAYGQSKVAAERVLVESGLPRWAWLRQTGIFSPATLAVRDPIMTHVPLAGVMEWVSVEDSARLLAGAAGPDVPEEFWGAVHNVGGGEGWRLTNWEFLARSTAAMGVRDMRALYEPGWFATRNFHGHWFTDSDALQALVPFREDTFDAALSRAVASSPALRAARWVPPGLVRRLVVEPLTRHPRGTRAWLAADDDARIGAFFGSREAHGRIGGWPDFVPPSPSRTPAVLDHGYDEGKDPRDWDAGDLDGAARFRGGRLVSTDVPLAPAGVALAWRCAEGHDFTASPRLVLRAGHWCPVCVADPARYAAQARANRFLAQVEDAG